MKKFLVLILTFCMLAALLTGCGGKPEETEEPSETETTTEEVKRPEGYTGFMDPLTGLETLPVEAVGKKPVAIMINNVVDALPQYGIEDAEIMMEMHVEHNYTRMMAIYPDYRTIPDVCSIRSCRYYYPIFAAGFDAIYVHWGIDYTYAYYILNDLDIEHVELDKEWYLYDGYISRDQERLNQGYAWEHTSEVHGSELPRLFNELGIDIKATKKGTAFKFNEYDNDVVPSEGKCVWIDLQYGSQSSQFEYDPAKGVYKKYHCHNPHIDSHTGNQLEYTNVVVLETYISYMGDGYHRYIDWEGGEDAVGYYISKGGIQEIRWSKEDEYARLMFYDLDGNELSLNTGKTFIAINYPGATTFSDTLNGDD